MKKEKNQKKKGSKILNLSALAIFCAFAIVSFFATGSIVLLINAATILPFLIVATGITKLVSSGIGKIVEAVRNKNDTKSRSNERNRVRNYNQTLDEDRTRDNEYRRGSEQPRKIGYGEDLDKDLGRTSAGRVGVSTMRGLPEPTQSQQKKDSQTTGVVVYKRNDVVPKNNTKRG